MATTTTPKERVEAFIKAHGLTFGYEFVPWSISRNRHEKHRTLNWRFHLTQERGGFKRIVMSGDYSAGIGHCPAYKAHGRNTGMSLWLEERIIFETEEGKTARNNGEYMSTNPGPAILPDDADVFVSLILDAGAIDQPFKDWAEDMGLSDDSIKAKATYDDCIETAQRLTGCLGRKGFDEAREACQDY